MYNKPDIEVHTIYIRYMAEKLNVLCPYIHLYVCLISLSRIVGKHLYLQMYVFFRVYTL